VAKVDEVLNLITNMPRVHPVIYKNVRRAVVKRFPYVVYYEVETDRIVIISVFHSSRNPSIWKARAT
jgi:plasmid stabilization system protein ParE